MTDMTETAAATPAPETTAAAEPQSVEPTPAPAEPPKPADTAEKKPGDSADPDPNTGADPAAEGQPQPKKKGGGFQDRIDKLTRTNYEKDYRIRQLESELAKTRKTEPVNLDTPLGPKPTLDQFENIEDYDKALSEYSWKKGRLEERQEIQKTHEAEKQRQEEYKQLERQSAFYAREQSAKQKYADYAQTVESVGDIIAGNQTVMDFVVDGEVGTDVAYHLGKNPEVLGQIVKMSPMNALRELIKIEERLKSPPPKTTTKAPDPVKPVGGRETVSKGLGGLAASDDVSAYIARMNKAGR